MFFSRTTWLGLLFLLVATPAAGQFSCGYCTDMSESWCDTLEMDSVCHAWQYDEDGPEPRRDDPHTVGEIGAGNETCIAEHPHPCDDLAMIDEELRSVDFHDAGTAFRFAAKHENVWVEVNAERGMLQLFASCPNLPEGAIVASLSVTPTGPGATSTPQ